MRCKSAHWAGMAERGSAWGLHLVAAAYGVLGRRAALTALLPAVAWFYLTGRVTRQVSRDYLARLAVHAGPGVEIPAATPANVFRHMLAFAEAGLDKLAAWRGDIKRSELDFPNEDVFERLIGSGRGALFISAHLGNLEITRALAVGGGIARVNAVVYTAHARRFAATLAGASDCFGVNLLEVSDFGPDTAMLLKDKVDQGELLVIVGDRTPPSENGRVVSARFLGKPAQFPQGPFVLAHLLECPVYLFFCLKEADGYRIHLEPFAERVVLPRKGRQTAITDYVEHYARRLEAYCMKAPLQWFNFFDFWRDPVQQSPTQRKTEYAVQQKDFGA